MPGAGPADPARGRRWSCAARAAGRPRSLRGALAGRRRVGAFRPLRASSGTAALAGSVAPRGGIFDARAARVTSRVLPHGAGTAAAEVRREPSRPDGRACLVLDHSRASLVARGVRDGLRLLRSGLHLGRAYREGLRVADLTLGA